MSEEQNPGKGAGTLLRRFLVILALCALCAAALFLSGKLQKKPVVQAGPVRIQFTLPPEQVNRPQAIMSIGQPNSGVIVFISSPDATHLEVGVDVWGTGKAYRSKPAEIVPNAVQEMVIELTSLYPLDNPAVADLPHHQQEELREALRVELNGKSLISLRQRTYDSKPDDISVGHSAIGGSLADPEFHGRILNVERLPFQPSFPLIDRVEVTVNVDFSGAPLNRRMPLFSVGQAASDGIAFGELSENNNVRFGFASSEIGVMTSDWRPVRGLCDVNYQLGFDEQTGKLSARLKRKGEIIGGTRRLRPRLNPAILYPGINQGGGNTAAARFVGRSLEVLAASDQESAFTASSGAYEIFITLPSRGLQQPEPLLITGSAGAADLVYIKYIDETHVAFGIDHWGAFGVLGEPIALDPRLPHRITISHSALFPPASDKEFWLQTSSEVQRRCLNTAVVLVDGEVALRAKVAAYPTARKEVTVGKNLVGGSSCGPIFTGTIHALRRSGIPTVLKE